MAAALPQYTVDDLQRFPDDGNRYELLDGMLLVTPQPALSHELIASRLRLILANGVQAPQHGYVLGPGVVVRPPKTQLQPDLLVVPFDVPPKSSWESLDDQWLVVEILSPSSRIYDREFKRNAYLALGVREVWIVDSREKIVEVSRSAGKFERFDTKLHWSIPGRGEPMEIDLLDLFDGID